jgi:hypothetical protein
MKKILYILICFFSIACEKYITVDLPQPSSKVVVDGYVEAGLPPYILLSRNQGFFEPINSAAINNSPETNAIILINDGLVTDTMLEVDTVINGFTVRGVYVANPLKMIGVPGRKYSISIKTVKNEILTSSALLPGKVPLDSVWFKVAENQTRLGFAWARLSDPDTLGNCYRWFAKRQGKDSSFIAPIGSVFEDKFINGKTFDFAYNRGTVQNSTANEDVNEEAGFYKKGDTIVVKFCTIDRGTFDFWRDAETQIVNTGSPFAVPSNVKSNIIGGIGLFAAYTASYDTIRAAK